jgi:polyhydroxyalkanoate synthesis regulator phasin
MATKGQKKAAEIKLVPGIESGMREMEKGVENLVEQMTELAGQSIYFGLGTVIFIKEGLEEFVEKAVKKGQASEKDVVGKIRSVFKVEPRANKVEAVLEARIEAGVRKVLNSLDIPSKSDVERLSNRVAELSGRVSKLIHPPKMKKPVEA